MKKPKNYWTKEKCFEEVLKYNTKKEFFQKSQGAYMFLYRNGLLNDACPHMRSYKKHGYWTKEKCFEEALKYESRSEFQKKSGGAYCFLQKHNLLDEACDYGLKKKPKNYWTKEKCFEEALKYESRSEFKKKSGGAYNFLNKNKLLDEACSHMIVIGNKFKRLIYVYKFSDNHVYVGLTFNIKKRDYRHMTNFKSAVYKHIKKTGLKPSLTYTDFMDVDKATVLEGETIEKYKKKGFNILNKSKAGAVGGGTLKWNKKMCLKEALKCKSRTDFYRMNNSAYNSARRNGWMNEICKHMNK